MNEELPSDVKPKFTPYYDAETSIPLPTSPIIIDSDSSSNFSPLEELELTDDFDLNLIEAEISAELGELPPVSSPAISSSQDVPLADTFTPLPPDTTETRNPDEIHLSSDEDTKPLNASLPMVPQQVNSSTQTPDFTSDATPYTSKQKPQHRQTNKYVPYQTRRNKPKFTTNSHLKKAEGTSQTPEITPPIVPLTPPPLPPIFTPNYAMAAATLSAAAFLQPFLQMQPPPGFLNIALPPPMPPFMPLVPPDNKTEPTNKIQFIEGPSSTSDFIRSDTFKTQSHTSKGAQSQHKHPRPTMKWRNSSHYRESAEAEIERDTPTTPATLDTLPSFSLTQLRNLSTETGNLDPSDTTPDTTIPTLRTSCTSDPLFKLPSSQTSNPSEQSPGSSGDERVVTYDANPSIAGGRRVIEFSDLAPSTASEAIEALARNIGPIEEFTFHQGLLYSRATVTYAIPKYALQCRRKYHRHYLDGVHISCGFLQGDSGPILKFPDT